MSEMLSSWKEIAQFFGKGVRTVQRWEKTLDLPIHRPPGAPSNVVLAKESDLEEWMNRGMVAGHPKHATPDDLDHAFHAIEDAIHTLAEERHQPEASHESAEERAEREANLRKRIEDLRNELDHASHNGNGSHGSIAA